MGLLIAKHLKNELIKEAVKVLNDENKQYDIIKNDANLFEIRELATKQITDNNLLKEIIFDTTDTTYENNIRDIREIAVKQITDEKTLEEIIDSYYDETINTKYGLNVVKKAAQQINDEKILISIAEKNYDEEITNITLEKVNEELEKLDKTKLRNNCDDDLKVKRMHAVENINDDELLLDIAMNAKYMDVRQKALSKIQLDDEKINTLKNIILKEQEYNNSVNEYITLNEDNPEKTEELINKANKLEVEYKKIGNSKKEKFYNDQCKLFKNNK